MRRRRGAMMRMRELLLKTSLIMSGLLFGFALYHRTTNMWTLKNLGDGLLIKTTGRRPIILGAFYRSKHEMNIPGHFIVLHFLGDGRCQHSLFCFSTRIDGSQLISRAHIQRIHQGKRAANDLCSWSGHLAECEVSGDTLTSIRVSTVNRIEQSIEVRPEIIPSQQSREPLVVCIAPMYIYTDWQILLLGLESWLSLGATKVIIPIQSASTTARFILAQYEAQKLVIVRDWPKWPVLSDVNPNGLVLSRGLEESHVNCLHAVKPWADLVVFTDLDDILLPVHPNTLPQSSSSPTPINLAIIQSLFREHPQAGSLLFEHRDVQLILPEATMPNLTSMNFNFLRQTEWKQRCNVWRMKTRVVVNASRVDSVNMHETGIHRFGHVQVRVPCRRAHFYHFRHTYKVVSRHEEHVDMNNLVELLNKQWTHRLSTWPLNVQGQALNRSSTESFADFDRCMGAINAEHWTLRVSRCLTPFVCYSRLSRNMDCIATLGQYSFVHSGHGDYVIVLNGSRLVNSEPNCEAPIPGFSSGDHFFLP